MMNIIVDLSHPMIPNQEEYGLELETLNTTELYPQYKVDEGYWYILQSVHMGSHCGTHIEFPYHHNREGLDAGTFPLNRLIGDCVLLDYTHKKPNEAVTLDEIASHNDEIRIGDMVLLYFNCAQHYRTEKAHVRPYITTDAIQWLIEEKLINLIGSDASGIEVKGVPNQPNHELLMRHQIPIIEFAANLELLRSRRFTLIVLPLRIKGLDACPIRLIAMEEDSLDFNLQ